MHSFEKIKCNVVAVLSVMMNADLAQFFTLYMKLYQLFLVYTFRIDLIITQAIK